MEKSNVRCINKCGDNVVINKDAKVCPKCGGPLETTLVVQNVSIDPDTILGARKTFILTGVNKDG